MAFNAITERAGYDTAEIEAIDVDGVEDVTLAHLLRSKRDEMRLQARLLAQRCTPEFRSTSELLFGGVDDRLREVATAIVSAVPAPVEDRAKVGAQAVHERAMVEIEAYRQTDPDVEMHSRIRDDVTGVLVEGDSLLISTDARVDTVRLDALVHHRPQQAEQPARVSSSRVISPSSHRPPSAGTR